jgi:hypothetical protein
LGDWASASEGKASRSIFFSSLLIDRFFIHSQGRMEQIEAINAYLQYEHFTAQYTPPKIVPDRIKIVASVAKQTIVVTKNPNNDKDACLYYLNVSNGTYRLIATSVKDIQSSIKSFIAKLILESAQKIQGTQGFNIVTRRYSRIDLISELEKLEGRLGLGLGSATLENIWVIGQKDLCPVLSRGSVSL